MPVTVRDMKGRPKKAPERKKSERVPFVASTAEKNDYAWAAELCGHDYISEWIRKTLNAEVERLRKRKSSD